MRRSLRRTLLQAVIPARLTSHNSVPRPPGDERSLLMETVASADGTTIAYDRHGDGPPLITAAGAFCSRLTTDPLARALAERFTVLNYDRRGRGDSGDTAPYAVEREIED